MLRQLIPIKNVLGGIMVGFLAIMGVRITYPMADIILGLWTETTQMKVVAILVMWLVYFFILWIMVWAKFFEPTENTTIKGGIK